MQRQGIDPQLLQFRRRLALVVLFIAGVVLVGWVLSPYYKIGFNGTQSVEGWVFLIDKQRQPKKGELVAFWPPENEFYHNIWFVKYLTGVPGDRVAVDVRNRVVTVAGKALKAKATSSTGVGLNLPQEGEIPAGKLFVSTPFKDSFDSRYAEIGLIDESMVIGTAYRLL